MYIYDIILIIHALLRHIHYQGYVQGVAVYRREFVAVVKSRNNWLTQHGREILRNEVPVKVREDEEYHVGLRRG